MSEDAKPAESGFEYRGEFYRLTYDSDFGKDMMIIDRLTAMPLEMFQSLMESLDLETVRAPVLLAIIGCSIRAKHPEWSVERIVKMVSEINLRENITFIGGEVEEAPSPPADGSAASAAEPKPSHSPPDGSSFSPTREDTSNSETSYAIPV